MQDHSDVPHAKAQSPPTELTQPLESDTETENRADVELTDASNPRPPQSSHVALANMSHQGRKSEGSGSSGTTAPMPGEPSAAVPFPNGYHFPPKHSFGESVKLGSLAFWKYCLTPVGFLVTLYGLNVVAWGGMLFLLLCNASPAMCYPTCDDIDSPRRKWIEYDSQILNALFCVTGFGLAPWRFRDLYFLLKYRLLVHLGPRNVGDELPFEASALAVPLPEQKMPDAPLTGVRAQPTKPWKLDLVIWLMVWNTFFQCCLCGFMWGMNRYDRPGWATGLFIGIGCVVAATGGLIMFFEGKAVQGVEGVVISDADRERLKRDREQGIWHYNNMKDKDPAAGDKGRKKRRGDS